MTEDELERALANIAEKRAELGFDEGEMNDSYSPRPSTSRPSSRSTSPSQGFEDEYDEEDPTADDQHAAMRLMCLKLCST
jgi:hypothetical protein